LKIYNTSVQQFASAAQHKYDIIISNPPFYENNLKSNDAKRNLALHSAELKLEELIKISGDLLKDDGKLFILIPYNRTEQLSALIREHLSIKEIVFVKQTPKRQFFRSMFLLEKEGSAAVTSEMIVMGGDGRYDGEFIKLLQDYYLLL
jgi:tRNA1Val (adenine37-N6)-methyltransferase